MPVRPAPRTTTDLFVEGWDASIDPEIREAEAHCPVLGAWPLGQGQERQVFDRNRQRAGFLPITRRSLSACGLFGCISRKLLASAIAWLRLPLVAKLSMRKTVTS